MRWFLRHVRFLLYLSRPSPTCPISTPKARPPTFASAFSCTQRTCVHLWIPQADLVGYKHRSNKDATHVAFAHSNPVTHNPNEHTGLQKQSCLNTAKLAQKLVLDPLEAGTIEERSSKYPASAHHMHWFCSVNNSPISRHVARVMSYVLIVVDGTTILLR